MFKYNLHRSTLSKEKIHLPLKASIELKFKVKFYFEWSLENKLKKFVKDQNNSNIEVKFYGFLEIKKINRIINEYDVIVLPSRFDGFGSAISEAINMEPMRLLVIKLELRICLLMVVKDQFL